MTPTHFLTVVVSCLIIGLCVGLTARLIWDARARIVEALVPREGR